MRYYKKIILLLLLTLFLSFSVFSFTFAAEVTLPGWDPEAVGERELLPAYIRHIFNLSLAVIGLVAFGVLVYAGFRYLTSAGDPTKISDAKDQILAAFLGLVILLASYLILATIDPHLVVLQTPELKPSPVVEPPPLPPFDFTFSIRPTAGRIHPDSCYWANVFCRFRANRNETRFRLEAKLKSGTPEIVTFSVKNIPNKVRKELHGPGSCKPTCNTEFRFISDGAAPGTYNITIEARSGEIVRPAIFFLTIAE